MTSLRVMPSFGTPRPTTNPYIVMLGRSLTNTPGIELVPFSWRAAIIGDYDVFHLHWAEVLVASPSLPGRIRKRLLLFLLAVLWRVRRATVVRTVHNLDLRESSKTDRFVIRFAERSASHEIHLNEVSFSNASAPATLIPHGDYREWFGEYVPAPRHPDRLGFVGLIRPYKGVESLIQAYLEAKPLNSDISLQVAGRTSSPTLAQALEDFATSTPDVNVELEYVSDQRMVEIITSSALVVLPYTRMDNSGAAVAALSLSRPVLVPRNPTTSALAAETGNGWVQLFDGELTGAALLTALENTRAVPPDSAPSFTGREWSDAGRAHLGAYEASISSSSRRARKKGMA